MNTTINAFAVKKAGGPFEPYSYEAGTLGDHEVEIEVLHCGICHSDLSMANNEWAISEYPLVGGHEVIGRIASVGARVNHMETGTVVGLGWHSGYCGHCASCESGDQNLCADARGTIVSHHVGLCQTTQYQATSRTLCDEQNQRSV